MATKISRYSLHPGYAREATARRKILERTGSSFEEWVERTKLEGPDALKDRREWLKSEHGFTTNYAWWIADACEGPSGQEAYDPEKHVQDQYVGKEHLLPLYEKLLDLGFALGSDVKACPCQTMVPLYRKHVFAQIKPSSKSRIDLGLALRDAPASGRLQSTGGYEKKDRITHRIMISTAEDIDAEVRDLLKRAYDLDGR